MIVLGVKKMNFIYFLLVEMVLLNFGMFELNMEDLYAVSKNTLQKLILWIGILLQEIFLFQGLNFFYCFFFSFLYSVF